VCFKPKVSSEELQMGKCKTLKGSVRFHVRFSLQCAAEALNFSTLKAYANPVSATGKPSLLSERSLGFRVVFGKSFLAVSNSSLFLGSSYTPGRV
jgi:hypothetical protein